MTDPQLDIEAGVAALRKSIDELSALQAEGSVISSVDLSSISDADWFYIFSDISNDTSHTANLSPRPIASHDLTSYYWVLEPQDNYRVNYVEYYAILMQSGIFEDNPDAGV
jgi:hypothetical protein